MTYRIDIAPAALREIKKLEPQAKRRVQATIELLAETPRPPAAKPLIASGGAWRVRVGDYRVIYDIHDDRLVILVLRAGHRREIYRG
ncbi:type II toxin-antitoxin system RelE family toxin [Leifsonia aquatica]|uniref:type II toxin-antitoxin system RelE family toxin n=1 Tax=Leifsonia aquatica TaxID=144185 RepID=UPI0028A9038E|nr:type II toxin-antitoxin system RelE/ParE family toxin [Leifsonia aquatica]